jgi:hypothetical protein
MTRAKFELRMAGAAPVKLPVRVLSLIEQQITNPGSKVGNTEGSKTQLAAPFLAELRSN